MKCPLCESKEFQDCGKTIAGDRKYRCEVCQNFFTSRIFNQTRDYQRSKLRLPEINFLNEAGDRIAYSESKYSSANHTNRKQSYRWGIIGFLLILCIYSFMCIWLKIDINQPQAFDSYTSQALAWRNGHLDLPENYSWLEIAIYKGKYFLCFPPIPTIPMLFLSFFFDKRNPSNWLMIICFFASYFFAYKLVRRFRNTDFHSAVWSVFLICGSSFLDISLFGWVWYMGQSVSFLMTLICIFCLTYSNRFIQGVGLFVFSLTVGCRPMQAIYAPLILFIVYHKNEKRTVSFTLKNLMPLLIAPIIVAFSLGLLNFLRFDSIFEFGYKYLPEFATEPQFSFSYLRQNFLKLFTEFPIIDSFGNLKIPLFGFAFYIANPIFILLGLRIITCSNRPKTDWFLLGNITLQFFLLMLHRTFGAWQFGTRFLIDLLPMVLVLCTRCKQPLRLYEMVIIVLGIAFNIYGSIIFRTLGK